MFNERRRREDLFVLGKLRLLEHVDYLELIAPLQLLFADAPQVRHGHLRPRTAARDVEPQHVVRQGSSFEARCNRVNVVEPTTVLLFYDPTANASFAPARER